MPPQHQKQVNKVNINSSQAQLETHLEVGRQGSCVEALDAL